MPRYNTPPDILDQIQRLKARIDRLERFSPINTMVFAAPIKRADFDSSPVAVTSTTFVDTHVFTCIWLAPCPIVRIFVTATDAATAGEFKIVDGAGQDLTDYSGAAVAVNTIPVGIIAGVNIDTVRSPNYFVEGQIGQDKMYKLQVRRTVGTGTLNVRAKYLYQVPVTG